MTFDLDIWMQGLGWVGNLIFAFSAVPQAWLSFRQGHSQGLSNGLLGMWFSGELIAIIYGLYENLPIQLMTNYLINFTCLVIIIWYRLLPRESNA